MRILLAIAGSEDGGRDHRRKNGSSLQKLEEARKRSPWEPLGGARFC